MCIMKNSTLTEVGAESELLLRCLMAKIIVPTMERYSNVTTNKPLQ